MGDENLGGRRLEPFIEPFCAKASLIGMTICGFLNGYGGVLPSQSRKIARKSPI